MSVSTDIRLDTVPCVVMSPHKYPQAVRKANSYWCPVGPRAGLAHLLMFRKDLAALDGTATHTLKMGDTSFGPLYLVGSFRLGKGGPEDDNSVHMVKFADRRILAERMTDSDLKAYNIRSYANKQAYLTGTYKIDVTTPWTWQTLFDDLWGELPSFGSAPTLPYTPDGTPENFRFIGVNAWDAIHEILTKIGCTTAYDPIGNTFTVVRLGSVQAFTAQDFILYDASPIESDVTSIPEKIRVYAHTYYQSYGQERDTELATNWSLAPAAFTDVATSVSGAVAGTLVQLWDDLPRVLDEDNSLDNTAAIASRAAEVAANWVQDQQTERKHRTYQGIGTALPGSQIKAVLWRQWGDGTKTELSNHPGLPGPFTGDMTPPATGAVQDNLRGPDLARKSYPNYPRLPNIVRVWDSGSSAGESVAANGSGFHPGTVERWVAGTMASLDACWILFVDDFDDLAGAVNAKNGDYYGPGRLCGMETDTADQRPIYLVRRGGGEPANFWAGNGTSDTSITANSINAPDTVGLDSAIDSEGGTWALASDALTITDDAIFDFAWSGCFTFASGAAILTTALQENTGAGFANMASTARTWTGAAYSTSIVHRVASGNVYRVVAAVDTGSATIDGTGNYTQNRLDVHRA